MIRLAGPIRALHSSGHLQVEAASNQKQNRLHCYLKHKCWTEPSVFFPFLSLLCFQIMMQKKKRGKKIVHLWGFYFESYDWYNTSDQSSTVCNGWSITLPNSPAQQINNTLTHNRVWLAEFWVFLSQKWLAGNPFWTLQWFSKNYTLLKKYSSIHTYVYT